MILWIESQSTPVIAVTMFALCYMLAAVIHVLVGLLARSRFAGELKATTPVMLTPLAVLLGLLIAFLANRVWTNIDHANAYIADETSALRQTLLLADALPSEIRDPLRKAIRQHVAFVEAVDWPSMAQGTTNSRKLSDVLARATTKILAFNPTATGQQVAQQRIVIAIEQAHAARLNRLLLSETAIAPIQWQVIMVLSALIMLTICMVHLDKKTTTVVNLFVFSTAVATCLVLIMVNDRPFASGGITLRPLAFQEVIAEIDQR